MIDFDRLAWELIPIKLRKLRFFNLIISILKPIVLLFEKYSFEIVFTSEKSSLERYLNDVYSLFYDINDRDNQISATEIIYIETIDLFPSDFFFKNQEPQTSPFLYNVSESVQNPFLFNQSQINPGHDFIVFVPNTLVFDTVLLTAQINQYKVAGKKFIIQTY